MRRMLLVGAVMGFTGVANADDKIVVKDSNKTVIVNGPVTITGNNNIVQIGNNNTVIINQNSPNTKTTTSKPNKPSGKPCDVQAARHDAQVAAWMAMMKK